MTSLAFVRDNDRKTGKPFECRLHIFIDDTTGAYAYRFERSSILLGHPDDIVEFVLFNQIANGTTRILKHISTPCEPKGSTSKKVEIKTANGAVVGGAPGNPYAAVVKRAGYAMALEEYEMLHIGLVVEIVHDAYPNEPFRLICDPQVGNGPP